MGKVLIYGGSGAVGSETARLLKEKEREVHLAGMDREGLERLAEELGCGFSVADVRDPESFSRVTAEAGREIEGLVYAVGTINLKSIRRLTPDDWLDDFRINGLGAALALQAALSALRKGGSNPSVVLYSSIAARQGFSLHGSISMAKAAVEGLVVSMAAELAPAIRVNAIAPSLLDESGLSASILAGEKAREELASRHPLKRLGTPRDIASMTVFLLSQEAGWITGQVIGIDGGRSSNSD